MRMVEKREKKAKLIKGLEQYMFWRQQEGERERERERETFEEDELTRV